ncbi:MAG: hypothetical protein EZS28_042448 [Streblomastix strix]|uniref:Uncharacterized protein n=1 Tax=Streblomastix strix TaxID=222440 RepID=A0A5J4TUT2_9EUKA|nr:MAG: hypothetical protein EZS28_042448 [Streblomastix strix]
MDESEFQAQTPASVIIIWTFFERFSYEAVIILDFHHQRGSVQFLKLLLANLHFSQVVGQICLFDKGQNVTVKSQSSLFQTAVSIYVNYPRFQLLQTCGSLQVEEWQRPQRMKQLNPCTPVRQAVPPVYI